MTWPLDLLVIACLCLLGWAICRMVARRSADEAHANLARLLAEQADDRERADERVIADNLDV